jgi:hypothetical protein
LVSTAAAPGLYFSVYIPPCFVYNILMTKQESVAGTTESSSASCNWINKRERRFQLW